MNNAFEKYQPIALYDPKIHNGYTIGCQGDKIRSNLLTPADTDVDDTKIPNDDTSLGLSC